MSDVSVNLLTDINVRANTATGYNVTDDRLFNI